MKLLVRLGPVRSSTHPDRRLVFLVDLAVAMALAALAAIIALNAAEEFGSSDTDTPSGLLSWMILFGSAWAVPFRRIRPVAALAVGAVLQIVVWSANFPDSFLATALLIYSAASTGTSGGRKASVAASIGLTLWTISGVIAGEAPLFAVPLVGLFGAAATALGWMTAGRQAYTRATEAKAEALERSRGHDRERALEAERARIARELHDVVAHGLSVMVVQASAARRILDRDPQGADRALEQIEQTGRNALDEMRHVLSAIRTDPGESWQPAPGLGSLDELVEEMAATGIRVEVDRSQDHRDEFDFALDPLPATVDLTAYRIVQAALTNVLKHVGSGARATVQVSRSADVLDLRIADDGRGGNGRSGRVFGGGRRRGGDAERDGNIGDIDIDIDEETGHGLRGMQERVEVFGGDFSAGPQPGGGFAVGVSLPLEPRIGSGRRS